MSTVSHAGPAVVQRWKPATAARRTTLCSVAVVALAAVGGRFLPVSAGPVLLVTAGLFGLPHGAVDHLALGWARGRIGPARPVVLLAYALAAAAAAGAALTVPVPALLVLLLLSAAHFAEGEAAFDRLRGGTGAALPAAALGLVVVAVPLVLRPGAAGPLLRSLDPALPAVLAPTRLPLLAVTSVLVLAGLASSWRAGQRRVVGELALVAAAAILAPPLVIFSAWFAGWHAPRHLVRLAALEPVGDGRARVRRLALGVAGPTVAAVLGLTALVLVLGQLPGAVLVVLLALTVPHAAVVGRLDRLARASGAAVMPR